VKRNQVAGIIEDSSSSARTSRLARLLDFLGIPSEIFQIAPNPLTGGSNRVLCRYHSVIGPLPAAVALWNAMPPLARHSFFFYTTDDSAKSCCSLRLLTGCREDFLQTCDEKSITVDVSPDWADLTGPMHGLRLSVKAQACDRVATVRAGGSVSTIIRTDQGAFFLCCENGSHRAFVSCSSEIPDLEQPLNGKRYDVTRQFLSAVPLLMYLKWAFRDVCRQANEVGACLILDDPPLKRKYGFCDFRLLDAQMKDHAFTTSIAMIPWNARRTSAEMASLVRASEGRLTVSVHGCDHTAREFGVNSVSELSAKVESVKRRMEQHREATGIPHEAIMIFPQGIFSRESLRVLQEHGFVAAVNTEPLPFPAREALTIGDAWALAITKYSSFPLFTRRYPADGLANFAFDILLGKPCLIVEHHGFFKGEHRDVVRLVNALNSLSTPLRWRSLGDVIRRSYLCRFDSDGVAQVRMFATELLLKNDSDTEREYRIEKPDAGSVGIKQVIADGQSLNWHTDGFLASFVCSIPPGKEVLLRVRYSGPASQNGQNQNRHRFFKVATRRYLCEFRDNFLSRHDRLMTVAKRARSIVTRHQSVQ
jgi:hypothetical protein